MLTRRDLLKSVPVGIGIAAGARALLNAQDFQIGGAHIKLGVASYSFRNFSRAQAISMTLQLGTHYMNVKPTEKQLPMDSTPEQIDAAVKEFHAAGIIFDGCGNVDFKKDDEADIRHNFEFAKRAGFPVIVCAPSHVTLPKLEKFVKEYNIKIAVHNHGPEDKDFFPTPQSVLAVVKDLDPRMGCCVDIGHTARAGKDPVESIAEVGPRLFDVHAKDLADPHNPDWKVARDSQVAVGEGKLPIKQVFAQLIKMKYRYAVDLEYEIHADDPLPGMQKSFAYMRGVLNELKGA
ncbi:MAG TPA: sugar phosphate isomerase/epimerase [Bryobacteraceae bacterium]|jgi:sugar phosphate isomerase/epimerase|nr:sugar phosphate isomerase/epimerase [Bryobacteraceae bacterium]